jgi:replication factor A1
LRIKKVRLLRQKRSIGEYLAFLAIKYEMPPEEFLNALRIAEGNKTIKVENLTIRLRAKLKDKSIFLIKKNSEVIAQFPVSNNFLLDRNNQLMNFMETTTIRKYLAKKNRMTPSNNIKDLRPGMTKVNLKAKILKIAEPKRVVTRYGNNANIVKVLIGDETGTIKLCLWNEQIDNVTQGDIVQIENAQASAFRGERQLALGKKGTLTTIESSNDL